ncbi:MAG: mandelate racemase/muconate lactonizing enzyme family protein [Verrucomicrobia bacterium]|nr:mandelate racemase/muconate lactonizing enzyme family protein [Verrucomicrobiota bacterium]
MPKQTDIRIIGATLYFLPVRTRVPLKFGSETLVSVICARVRVRVRDRAGKTAEGWGETPLSVQWAWPGRTSIEHRQQVLKQFCIQLAGEWAKFDTFGHPIEIGADFCEHVLPAALERVNGDKDASEKVSWLAALICSSMFDIAVHDAYGNLHKRPVYETYGSEFMNRTLGDFMTPAEGHDNFFRGRYPQDILQRNRAEELPAWHLVGGLDLLDASEQTGDEPKDGYPVVLTDWIQRDELKCLKVKLRGNDSGWDFERMKQVGQIAAASGVDWLSADFNCTVTNPDYVNTILDRLRSEQPRIYGMILYVEQPFPYDLEANQIDVHSVSSRKPLFLDESAHDWRMLKLGRTLGWNGVALKTCKTQTGAILSACWAKTHGMSVMVQDLTNPMLAQIPHVLLAAHVGTLFGVETNAMQFYPEASSVEAEIHPGLYRRRGGKINLSTVRGPGFGYRLDEMKRALPPAQADFQD